MYLWLIVIAVVIQFVLVMYTALAQHEGAMITIPLSLVSLVAALYGMYHVPTLLTVALCVVAGMLTLLTLNNATWGMPRPGGR